MKKIGFIGTYDKIDLILYISKILTILGKKVLIIDATLAQKSRYIIPAINSKKMYVTEFEEIDVAVGFYNLEDIKIHLGVSQGEKLEYDIIFIDTDNMMGFKNFRLEEANKNYFVTSFDLYSLKKGLDVLQGIDNIVQLTKIYFSKEMSKEEDDYLNFLASKYKVNWEKQIVYFPFENGDLSVIFENQRESKIKFKKLSVQYKDGLSYLTQEILEETNEGQVRRAMKIIEKGA